MDLSNLTPQQAAALAARVTRIRDYVAKVAERMDAQHWKPICPAYACAGPSRPNPAAAPQRRHRRSSAT